VSESPEAVEKLTDRAIWIVQWPFRAIFRIEPEGTLESDYSFLLAVGYALLTVAICRYEAQRIRASGPDMVTLFISFFVLQCCLPGLVIFACLPFAHPLYPTDNAAWDRILSRLDLPAALLVLGLTAWFVFFFYAFTALMGIVLRRLGMHLPRGSRFLVCGAATRLLGVVTLGTVLTLVSFWLIGDTLVERYANLILFRQLSEDVERNVLNAYAFSLTQSWLWLTVPALFVISETRGRGVWWYLCLGCGIALAVLSVSRRSIFIPILLAYLTLVSFDGRWRVKWILAASIPLLLWVGYGKEFFGAMVSGGSLEQVGERYSTVASASIRTASEIGITLVESWGSINLLDLDPRFGVDHLLSFLRRIPVGWFGWDPGLPTRIVRLSTEAFATPEDLDIPPGLFGQMWLDFGVLGPIVWALIFAFQVSIVQRVFALTIVTRQAAAALALITFIVALPLNTGSFDFTFSVDIIVLVLAILLTFKLVRVRVAHVDFDATTRDSGGTPAAPEAQSAQH
jgi:hypothetical protein